MTASGLATIVILTPVFVKFAALILAYTDWEEAKDFIDKFSNQISTLNKVNILVLYYSNHFITQGLESGLYLVGQRLLQFFILKQAAFYVFIPLIKKYQKWLSTNLEENDPFSKMQISMVEGNFKIDEIKLLDLLKTLFETEKKFNNAPWNDKTVKLQLLESLVNTLDVLINKGSQFIDPMINANVFNYCNILKQVLVKLNLELFLEQSQLDTIEELKGKMFVAQYALTFLRQNQIEARKDKMNEINDAREQIKTLSSIHPILKSYYENKCEEWLKLP